MGYLQHAWNAFVNRDPTDMHQNLGWGSSHRVDRPRLSVSNNSSIVNPVYNRIAIDAAGVSIRHARLDKNERYVKSIDSELNNRLSLEANLDQTGRAFIQDVVMSMIDEGCVAIVPIETSIDPKKSGSYDIHSFRTGSIIEWFPEHVRVRVYNEKKGMKEEVTLPKKFVGIIENPLYSVMNEPNSTMQRLIRKLNLLDSVDEQSSSGKLDIIVQLPYIIKTESRQKQAEKRKADLEAQLRGSKYGIAYIDGTEKVTQLNRPAENNLMAQITYLTSMLHSQLGLSEAIFNGTAEEQEMLNYYNRTLDPILSAITDEMTRKFLTKTARTQRQAIIYIREPFKLVPVNDIANIADKFTRNEILSSNELRSVVGFSPVEDPRADELRNKNLNQKNDDGGPPPVKVSDKENNDERGDN